MVIDAMTVGTSTSSPDDVVSVVAAVVAREADVASGVVPSTVVSVVDAVLLSESLSLPHAARTSVMARSAAEVVREVTRQLY
jgi:hypothetical protein